MVGCGIFMAIYYIHTGDITLKITRRQLKRIISEQIPQMIMPGGRGVSATDRRVRYLYRDAKGCLRLRDDDKKISSGGKLYPAGFDMMHLKPGGPGEYIIGSMQGDAEHSFGFFIGDRVAGHTPDNVEKIACKPLSMFESAGIEGRTMKITRRQLRDIIRETLELSGRIHEEDKETDAQTAKKIDDLVTGELKKIATGKSKTVNNKGADDSAIRAGAEAVYTLVKKQRLDVDDVLKAFGIKTSGKLKFSGGKLSQLNYGDPTKFKDFPEDIQKLLDPGGKGELTGQPIFGLMAKGEF